LNALHISSNGFYSGTINGLEEFTANQELTSNVAPIPSIQDVKVNFESVPWEENNLRLNHTQHRILISFNAVSLANADNIAFTWRLRGYDEKWLPVNKEHSASYNNLEPGDYVFELKACNQDSIWSAKPVQLAFTIQPAWWQQTWIKILSGFLLACMLWGLYKWRVYRLKKKANQKLQQLKIENELTQLEHTALRLQMNPHFLFNAMNSIQSVIGNDQNESARYYLAKFSKLMRQILNNSRKAEISLEEEIETLENYLLVEQFTNSIPFDYKINIHESVDVDFIQIPPMILQPFVENALKHGLRYLQDKKGLIQLTFTLSNQVLSCVIEDNGVGIEESSKRKAESLEPKHPSVAIEVTRKRLQLLHPKNSIYLEEIKEQQEIKGTKVTIQIHLNETA
jgi:two-component sensor histidine kinase